MAGSRLAGYWVATGIVAFALAAGGPADLLHFAPVAEGMAVLGYPPYVMTLLGIWKLPGAATLLAPGLPRLKEWAYAGTVIDLTGAAFSHLAMGEPPVKPAIPLFFAVVALISWSLRPASRRLPDPVTPAGGLAAQR